MNYNKILPIPNVPQEIIDAVNYKKLAVFIGAGVSRLLGSAGWDELAYNLIKTCFEKKLINYRESDSLKQLKDPKKIITICYHLLKKSNNKEIYYKTLENAIKANTDRLNSQNIYDEIYRLRALFITTNIDSHFHKYFEPANIVFKENEFIPSNIDRNKLYHIHGCLEKDRNSIIFTVPDYIKRYNQEKFNNFLKKIFEEYIVLFLGYGLAEFELLDFLITKSEKRSKYKELKHFILIPFYRGEENILSFERYYYNSMGIEVIPYEKDEKGYEQLYEVLKNWNEEINQVSGYLYDTYEYLEKFANNYEKSEEDKVFQLIKNDEPQRHYFFKCLASTSNPFPWLKPLKEKVYFNPADNPKPQEVPDKKGYFFIPHWNILGYLENVAKKNKEAPSDEITNLLLEIIQEIIDYKDENGERIENYRTDWVMVKVIFSLPIEKISNKHIEFVKIALNSKWDSLLVSSEIKETVLPKLLNEGEKAKNLILELLKVILDYKKIKKDSILGEEDSFDYVPIMGEYWLYESLKVYKPQISKICGLEAAKIAIQKIKEIVTKDKTQFYPIWIPTIEDNPQTSFPDKYQNLLVYFVRNMFEFSKPQEIKEVIKNLLNEEHSIFKRIAIYIINQHYKELNQLLWTWGRNPLDEISVKHELFELFKSHAKDFSDEQIEKIIEWIESKNYYIPEEIKTDEQKKEKFLAYQKKEWLYSLLNSGNPKIVELYNKYNYLDPTELKHPGFDFWMETKWGYESLVDIEEFLNKSNEEIAKYLDSFKDKENIDMEGIADSFRNAVKENPEKFTANMKPFLKIQRIYQYSLLWGLKEAWNLKKPINWDIVFDFISDLISSDDFWNEEYKIYNYRNWIISQIAELIEEGTKDDKHAFEPKLLQKAEKISLILAEKTESELPDMLDIVTSVLNSTKGKIFSAMINYSLRYARLYKTESEERWIKSIKEEFTKRLNRNIDPSIEFSVILGQYLANLYWLDKKWVINHINQIFPKENETHWQAAFTGYLFYSSRIYKDIYFLLRENNHYLKAIKTSFKDEHITERLAQHIAIGYIEDWENLDDEKSLISQLIENGNKKQLLAIITFFWMMREGINDKIKTKIKPLWKAIFEKTIENKESSENQEVISKLITWLILIGEIDDEVFEWLKPAVRYSSKYHNTTFLSEYLMKHVSKTPKKVGELYIEMLNNNIYLDYKVEDIQKTIKILYKRGEKYLADRICNLYGARGFDFLRDIYFEYNKKES
ncbi:conserved hypothetical protein [Deferribacter desulfuricans SSM1]|uniref:Uncharacterized protein n=1 Tax=Deferribacter desulfuricans (strain DSM 14783 / JCM 11476 / NBRC 101012 / SSM1) TaxID=639282 RepID=D3PB24_DEFDS|nr:SIR2 family protein [Deferribacter desulfuricans]BAI79797.1 conserved hypothetical protein [Deferribacter desulfuricans SSM1]